MLRLPRAKRNSRTILISYSLILIFFIALLSCNKVNKPTKEKYPAPNLNITQTISEVEPSAPSTISVLEQKLIDHGLVDIRSVVSDIQIDLKYATKNNFLNIVLYDSLEKIYAQNDVVEKLKVASNLLKETNSNYSLLVYDAVRPRSVQQKMWDHLNDVPVNERTKYVSNPVNASLHNFGAAVDLTIINQNGVSLDMGTDFDHFGPLAFPRLEGAMLKEGKLTDAQYRNRILLRNVMENAGFTHITTEWWHFNSLPRDSAWKIYKIVE